MEREVNRGLKPSQTDNKQHLSIDELIKHQRFLLETSDKFYRELQQFDKNMDWQQTEIEKAYTAEEKKYLKKLQTHKQNLSEIKAMKKEPCSLDCISDTMPKVKLLERKSNSNISLITELETSREDLQNAKERNRMAIISSKNLQHTLEVKKETVVTLNKEVKNEEEEIVKLNKRNRHFEQQNEEIFALKRKLNNQLQEIKGNIRVYCRVRPTKSEKSIIEVTSENTLKVTYEKQRVRQECERYQVGYMFEQIFNFEDNQQAIFSQLSQLVQSSIDGKNVCIFAYGQTGSGKTYTLLGPEDDNRTAKEIYAERGITQRGIQMIFGQIERSRKFGYFFKVFISIQEIYLENIFDLIKKAETVKDKCTEVQVTQTCEVLSLIKEAALNRKKACTNMNERSSRSHLIITLRLQGYGEKTNEVKNGSLVFVDLAGSERLGKSHSEAGERLKETQFINTSLSSLGSVINEMRQEAKHISFRNSKLTHVLQKNLQGDSKTLMFVNVSPDWQDMGPTKISLQFAQGVRECKMRK